MPSGPLKVQIQSLTLKGTTYASIQANKGVEKTLDLMISYKTEEGVVLLPQQ
mgnify:CR=1 FL=1